MQKHLILFTVSFPYDLTETFLEAELPFLAEAFECVTIIPMCGRELKRPIPSNVRVAKPFFASGPSQLVFFAFQYAKPRTWGHIIKAWIKAMVIDRRCHIAVFYRIFNWASYRSALETHRVVQEAVSKPKEVVAYSYWGHTPVFAIPILSRAGVPCAVRYHSVDLYVHAQREFSYIYRNARYFPWREEVARAASANLFISENGHRHFEQIWPNVLGKSAIISRLGVRDRGSVRLRPRSNSTHNRQLLQRLAPQTCPSDCSFSYGNGELSTHTMASFRERRSHRGGGRS